MYKIPLVDLSIQHKKLKKEINAAITKIVASNKFIMGEDVSLFEKEYARFCQTKYCVGAANGTVVIHLALYALGVGPGDEIITVPNTFIATSEAITQSGAKVVFCDIDPQTHTMDPISVEKRITKKTRAIVPVDIHGNPCQYDALTKLARKYKLFIVEDAAQAQGATFGKKRVGNWADVTTFSFFPAKNLGAWGDAGGVVTNDKKLYEKMKILVNHGRREKYIHDIEGFNYRLDTLQAAILRIKLKHLEGWNAIRRKHAQTYREYFKNIPEIECVSEMKNGKSVYHLFIICHKKRDRIKAYLADKGIETGIHYPVPLHLQPAYKYLHYKKGDLPVAEEKAEQILSLPMYPELTDKQIEQVVTYAKKAIT